MSQGGSFCFVEGCCFCSVKERQTDTKGLATSWNIITWFATISKSVSYKMKLTIPNFKSKVSVVNRFPALRFLTMSESRFNSLPMKGACSLYDNLECRLDTISNRCYQRQRDTVPQSIECCEHVVSKCCQWRMLQQFNWRIELFGLWTKH